MIKLIFLIISCIATLAVVAILFFKVLNINYLHIPFVSPLSSSNSLTQVLENEVKTHNKTSGIIIKNLKYNDSYSYNKDRTFETASLYKVWIMATAYQLIGKGQLKENDILEQKIEVLNTKFRIASESAEKKDGTLTQSVGETLEKMITLSDNYSALLLSERVRLARVATFLKTYGFKKSKVGTDGSTPVTTAGDMALFFEKLYQGKLANTENTQKMLSLLKKQQLNNKIPHYLPDTIEVAHKTGELAPLAHDAGIVYLPKKEYIIVVLSENNNRKEAEENIAQISKIAYDYFSK